MGFITLQASEGGKRVTGAASEDGKGAGRRVLGSSHAGYARLFALRRITTRHTAAQCKTASHICIALDASNGTSAQTQAAGNAVCTLGSSALMASKFSTKGRIALCIARGNASRSF